MLPLTDFIIAGIIDPLRIGITAQSTLWLLPLVAAISVVYKTTKMEKIKASVFLKEVVILFGSIVIFMCITAGILFAVAWLITE
jgi:hypothetical protein